MNEIAYQWGRFASWMSQVAAVFSLIVSAVLAVLTYFNVRASLRQATGMLQPALKLGTTFHNDPQHPKYDASGSAPGTSESGIGVLELLNCCPRSKTTALSPVM